MPTEYTSQPPPVFRDGVGSPSVDGDGEYIVEDMIESTSFPFVSRIPTMRATFTTRYLSQSPSEDFTSDPSGPAAGGITYTAASTDSVTVRVTFSAAVALTNALSLPGIYTIVPTLAILAAVPEAGPTPTYVDLTVEEMLDGQAYDVEIDETLEPA